MKAFKIMLSTVASAHPTLTTGGQGSAKQDIPLEAVFFTNKENFPFVRISKNKHFYPTQNNYYTQKVR